MFVRCDGDHTHTFTGFVSEVRRWMGYSPPAHTIQYVILCDYMPLMLTISQWTFALVVLVVGWLLQLQMRWKTHARHEQDFEGKWDRGVIEGDNLFDLNSGQTSKIKIEDDPEMLRLVDEPEVSATLVNGELRWNTGAPWKRRNDHFSQDVRRVVEISGVEKNGEEFHISRTDWGNELNAEHLSEAVQVEQVRRGCLIWKGRIRVRQCKKCDRGHVFGWRASHPSAGQFLVGDTLNILSGSSYCSVL